MFDGIIQTLIGSFERAPWGWGVFSLLIAGYLKLKPLMTKLRNQREADLLEERAAEMALMRERMERLEAERAVDRHRLNNVTQCLDALLLLLETSPEKAAQHVLRIKEMRAAQMIAESAEKGTIHGTAIRNAATAL